MTRPLGHEVNFVFDFDVVVQALRDVHFISTRFACHSSYHDECAKVLYLSAFGHHRRQRKTLADAFAFQPLGKVLIDKAPDGTRSPNLADAVMIAFQPASRNLETWMKLGLDP